LEKSLNKRSPISEPEDYQPAKPVEVDKEEEEVVRRDFSDERYHTVVVEKDNNQLGFCVKVYATPSSRC